MKSKIYFYIACSLAILAVVATPATPILCILAYFIGYPALFLAAFAIKNCKKRAYFLYGFGVLYLLFQMRWLGMAKYHGSYIVIAYVLVSFLFGLSYLLLGRMLPKKIQEMSLDKVFFVSLVFVFFEYARLWFICGFPFHSIGLILSAQIFSLQLASVVGGYGLSFLVLLYSLYAAKWFVEKTFWKGAMLGISPFVLGFCLYYLGGKQFSSESLDVAVLQTGHRVEEKLDLQGFEGMQIPSSQQLKMVVDKLVPLDGLDLMVLPEVCFPGIGSFKRYSKGELDEVLPRGFADFFSKGEEYSNLDVFKELSIYLNTDIYIGLIDQSRNSAFYLSRGEILGRYDKRRLLPFGEYIPFTFLQKFAEKYGLYAYFTPGKGQNILKAKWNILPTICYDEGFPDDFLRYSGQKPDFHINITNDAWFVDSNLSESHFYLAKIRSVENGLFTIRSCNTGVSAIISPKGQERKVMPEKDKNGMISKGIFSDSFRPYTIWTVFSRLGNSGLFLLMAVFTILLKWYSRRDIFVKA